MPECTGPNAVQTCMIYLSKNMFWFSGDVRNADSAIMGTGAEKTWKEISKIQGYKGGHTYSDAPNAPYSDIYFYGVDNKTIVLFLDANGAIKTICIDDTDYEDLNNNLKAGTVSIPKLISP